MIWLHALYILFRKKCGTSFACNQFAAVFLENWPKLCSYFVILSLLKKRGVFFSQLHFKVVTVNVNWNLLFFLHRHDLETDCTDAMKNEGFSFSSRIKDSATVFFFSM